MLFAELAGLTKDTLAGWLSRHASSLSDWRLQRSGVIVDTAGTGQWVRAWHFTDAEKIAVFRCPRLLPLGWLSV
jgi:hypothetical protein